MKTLFFKLLTIIAIFIIVILCNYKYHDDVISLNHSYFYLTQNNELILLAKENNLKFNKSIFKVSELGKYGDLLVGKDKYKKQYFIINQKTRNIKSNLTKKEVLNTLGINEIIFLFIIDNNIKIPCREYFSLANLLMLIYILITIGNIYKRNREILNKSDNFRKVLKRLTKDYFSSIIYLIFLNILILKLINNYILSIFFNIFVFIFIFMLILRKKILIENK